MLSISEAVEWFDFVENHSDKLREVLYWLRITCSDPRVDTLSKALLFFQLTSYTHCQLVDGSGGVNPIVVRSLGGLMKRLSKATDVVFCGRVLSALSRHLQ